MAGQDDLPRGRYHLCPVVGRGRRVETATAGNTKVLPVADYGLWGCGTLRNVTGALRELFVILALNYVNVLKRDPGKSPGASAGRHSTVVGARKSDEGAQVGTLADARTVRHISKGPSYTENEKDRANHHQKS
jgi:hypothetical protein